MLNLGVRPAVAIKRARARFEALGGVVLERTSAGGVEIFDDGARVAVDGGASGGGREAVTARLVVDAMGNASPISRQARGAAAEPTGVCIVVGTCASGFELGNDFGDLIYTNQDLWTERGGAGAAAAGAAARDVRKQYYWEAFPAGSGEGDRTTYLFTYLDAAPERLPVEQMLEDYWDLLPTYQRNNCAAFRDGKVRAHCARAAAAGNTSWFPPSRALSARRVSEAPLAAPQSVEQAVEDGDIALRRCLYGLFPTYRDSPLPPLADRVLAIGDASGIQSPLSFGGFGALTRHLHRYCDAVTDALESDALARDELATINTYLPNQAATWMFQARARQRVFALSSQGVVVYLS